jgi:ATP-binding cassette subfamily B (MDR/TAP) protein 1
MSLEEGYDTLIGEGGVGLSGGQEQRIAIARALVRRPQLLILDEATSALDRESAEGIQNIIKSMSREGVAILLISHDVQMMQAASRILVVDSGRIVESGEFEELKSAGGAFARLIGKKHQYVGLGLRAEDGAMTPAEARNRQSWQSTSFG